VGTLVMVRHGESLWNRVGRYQGQQDIGLSDEGIRQAEMLAQFFRSWRFEAFYASDLSRARETAVIIAKHPVTLDPRLREYAFGVWEGLTRAEIEVKYAGMYARRRTDINTPIPGGELGVQVQARVTDWLQEIAAAHSGTVLAVSHGGTIRTLIAALLEVDITRCYRLTLSNAGYSIIRWQSQGTKIQFRIDGINCYPRLKPL
jgi:broad specificity phosphatase PhoE